MSRLIVKNLPKNVTEEKIKRLFSEKGTITDIQLKLTTDGKFRQFAFIGYQNENEAEEAIKHFNNMFINTNKIVVEPCAVLGDSKKPKAWSKYAPDSTAFKKTHPESILEVNIGKINKDKKKTVPDEKEELLSKYQNDVMFEEFLELHAPEEVKNIRKNVKDRSELIESDNNNKLEHEASDIEQEVEEPVNKLADEKISDLEYMQKLKKTETKSVKKEPKNLTLFTIKLKGLPYSCKKKDIKDFLKPLVPFSLRIPTKIHGIAYVGFKKEKDFKKALLKDRSFIAGKRISVSKYVKKDNNSESNDDDVKKHKWASQEEALKNEEDIAESGKIFIRNLAYTTTEDDIEKLFTKFGPLAEVNLPIDSTTKKIKGFGTVVFVMPEHAVKAYSDLDGSVLHGRMLHLLPGKNKDTVDNQELEETSNYKKKKTAKQKAQAGSSHNWNSLFLGHDAVAEVMADTYSTSKEKVLALNDQGSAAVRLALGETQIVAETRKYLEQEGVILDAFNNTASKRSKTVIIVKNLPSKTDEREITKQFEKFGLLGRVVLPPSGITALVEFMEPSEARKAFTSLAYTKFKNVPLYLEWAPENSLQDKKVVPFEKQEDHNKSTKQVDAQDDEAEEEPEPDTTLFVKNLNFQTTDEALKKHFEGCGKIYYATVATKKDKTDSNKKMSMGYGFVRFMYKKSADNALKNLQQSVLDGKSLELKRSERTLNNEVTTAKKATKLTKQTGTKILVRNVPFQATNKEIRELFSTFGEIKALRLPKKMALNSNSHRGFAFVDFVTASDAKQAFEALSQSTHLYGRRLVLEWAAHEEGVDEIRKRTAAHFTNPEPVKSKKSVFNIE